MNNRHPERRGKREGGCGCENNCGCGAQPSIINEPCERMDPPQLNCGCGGQAPMANSRRSKRRMDNFCSCNNIEREGRMGCGCEREGREGCGCGAAPRVYEGRGCSNCTREPRKMENCCDKCGCNQAAPYREGRSAGYSDNCAPKAKCFEDSQTYKNLQKAFAGEAQARDKYTFFAKKAEECGYQQIGNIFIETADNELEHAEIWYKMLYGGIPNVEDCLMIAAKTEQYEWGQMYPDFAETARCEGYYDIARKFEEVAQIEAHHEERFCRLHKNMVTCEVFCKSEPVMWICMKCGHQHCGDCCPEVCPVCCEPKAFQEIKCENY